MTGGGEAQSIHPPRPPGRLPQTTVDPGTQGRTQLIMLIRGIHMVISVAVLLSESNNYELIENSHIAALPLDFFRD